MRDRTRAGAKPRVAVLRRGGQATFSSQTPGLMFLLRFLFRSILLTLATALLGRFLPILRRLLLLIGWRI